MINQANQPIDNLPDSTDTTLIGAWFNKKTANTGNDYSSNLSNLTIGSINFSQVGAQFNANNSNAIVSNVNYSGTTPATISAWVFPNSYGGGSAARIFSTIGGNNDITFKMTSGNRGLVFDTSGGSVITNNSGLLVSQWSHIVGTINSTGVTNIYVNGSSIGSPINASLTALSMGGSVVIGGANNSTNTFDGIIKDVRFYNEVKPASWISNEYKKSVVDKSLTFHIKNGDKDLTTFNNLLTNKAVILGNGMQFNGFSNISNTGDLFGAGNITIAIVFKLNNFNVAGIAYLLSNDNFGIKIDNGNTINVTSDSSNTNATGSSGQILFNNTYVLIATRDLNGIANIYVNGVLSGTANQASGTPISRTPSYIGSRPDGDFFCVGNIYDLYVFNRILSADEIKQLNKLITPN